MDSQDNGASRSMVMMRKDAWLAELDEAGNQAKTYTLSNEYAGHVSELNNSLTSENTAASYYITDEQGSIRYMLDQSGEVQNYYQYSAFGETIISEETTPNRLGYNAQTEDELTGLYYLRARYYAPDIGRFTQEDVIYNDGLNLYAYCNSNPVMYSDPSGFAKETCKSKVGGECGSESEKNSQVSYNRPSGFRKGVRDKVWDNARNATGDVIDPVTKRIMDKSEPWDMGHKPGYEFRKHQQSAENRGISRKQFLDEYNNPEHYRPELPSSNRSHKGEDITNNYFGD